MDNNRLEQIRNEPVRYIDHYDLDGVEYGRSLFNLEWISAVSETPKVIFDVGCYDCGDSIRFKQRFPDCEVYSFEASIYRHAKLQETAAKYKLNLVPYAVTDQDGMATFFDAEVIDDEGKIGPRIDAQGSFFKHTQAYKTKHPRIIQKNEGTIVNTTTVKSFCEVRSIDQIDLLYIDVEGAELQVIKGMGELRPKMIFVETLDLKVNADNIPMWEGATVSRQLEDYLFSIGYVLGKILVDDRLYYHASVIQ